MQFLTIPKNMTLASLADRIGERNVEDMLNTNSISRSVNVGKQFQSRSNSDIVSVDAQTKINILNTFVGDSDIYEKAALGSDRDWSSLSKYGCFSDAMKIPETLILPPAVDIIGNGEPIATSIYEQCISSLSASGDINPTIFDQNIVGGSTSYGIIDSKKRTLSRAAEMQGQSFSTNSKSKISPLQAFKIPWGEISLYSSLTNDYVDIPVYPEELSDGRAANFNEMPSMLYQYEPWYVYQSSGPRKVSFSFHLHRDFWTGDHSDGNAEYLIRFCESNCYPDYDGSAVNFPQVSLYIKGKNFITGIMNECNTQWTGPIGQDGYYLEFTLSFSITEVSPVPLNYTAIRRKGLIE